MFKKLAAGLLIAALAAAGVVAWRGDSTRAEGRQDPRQDEPPANANGLKPAQKIPITQVVLFNSGVGYFHRSGEVEGEARVDLQFSAADINDLIKSLVIQDARGQALPLRYDSQEPIEKTLKSFAIDLSSNPSYGQILNQMRGQKVEVTLQTNNPALNGLPGTLTGTIVGMETAHRPHSPTAPAVSEMELLNLACAEGLRSVPLSAVQRVRFLNPTVENELRRALEVVAVGHDSLKKTVHLGFKGDGRREVRVGYVVENPIWKTSYRLVKSDDGKWRLQAWANVENTSDEDWNDVKLTLVSSRPISFQMDLYPPLFIPRPTVEPALFASLRPPTYGGPITNSAINVPNFGIQGGVGFGGGGFGGQPNGAPGNGMNPGFNFIPQNAPVQMQNGQIVFVPSGVFGMTGGGTFGNLGGQFGNQGGQFGQQGGNFTAFNRYQNEKAFLADNNGRLNYEQMQQRRNADQTKNDPKGKAIAQQLGSALTSVDPEFIERARAADELGQPARYTIDQKVSLPRQQSVMLPILDEEIEAAKVSIYNERVHATRALHGLKIKNKTKQALMSGPVTVYEGDQPYSGDARMLDLQPNEERYISYALDTGVEIKPFDTVRPGPEMTARMENGQLNIQYKLRHTRTYVIVNRAPEDRKVVVEQPIRTGWKLVKPEKATEVTTELYRFDVDVKAGDTVKYEVSEELPRIDPFAVSKQADWTGFATSLGLDVWTENRRTPEESFLMQVVKDHLQVTHKDRRATTYFFRNNADEDRTIWLEHNVPTERMLLGNHEPVDERANRYRFKIDLKKGKTLSHTVSEELRMARPENFALQTLAGYATAKPGEDDGPAQRYVTELGFELWQTRKTDPETLVSARFVKGELRTQAREVEAITYHIRNRAGVERTFVLEHAVRPNWSVMEVMRVPATARSCQFTVKAAAGELVRQPVSEERVVPKKESVGEVSEDRVKVILASPAIAAGVKEGLQKAVGMRTALEQTAATLKDLREHAKEISEEQARLRTNMEKLPQTSELYKRYLGKLDQQETVLEKVQADVKEKEGQERTQKKEYDGFLEKLNVE
ncbi:MAG TPA: hypothetical protein VKE40_02965 [Gemmataceae bacterium]|nr:hypothetical protein [Gemmataceae bacterium]